MDFPRPTYNVTYFEVALQISSRGSGEFALHMANQQTGDRKQQRRHCRNLQYRQVGHITTFRMTLVEDNHMPWCTSSIAG